MTDEEIYIRAIDKAQNNGFNVSWIVQNEDSFQVEVMVDDFDQSGRKKISVDPYRVIFDNRFAIAIWGDTTIHEVIIDGVPNDVPEWRYQLGIMAAQENPFLYLSQFL